MLGLSHRTVFTQATRISAKMMRPRRDLNPCYRRERPVSWAELDDGDVLVSRAGFEPATLCLKGRCSTA